MAQNGRKPVLDVRSIGVGLVATAGAAGFLEFVNDFYAVHQWLFWRYAGAAVLAAIWGASCLAAGHRVLRLVLRIPLRFADEVALAFPLGVLIFGTGVFLLGLVHALGWFTFGALPLAMLASGTPLYRSLRRLRRHFKYRGYLRRVPGGWVPLTGALTIGLLFVYYPLLAPRTFMHDARWYHLAMAEHYAADGAITRFPEGWWLGAFPQLATYNYTWAFMHPKAAVFDRCEFCAHMELVVVLFVLAAIPSLVRLFLRGTRASASFVCFFLFPCIYLYDSNLSVGADHFAALYAVPIALALHRFWKRFDVRWGALLGCFLCAPLLTKYSAVILLVFPGLAVAARAFYLFGCGVRTRSFRWVLGLGALCATGLVLGSMHWLKNWVWYGDPLYPQLHEKLGGRPWVEGAEAMYVRLVAMRFGPRPGLDGILDGLRATLTFSFVPNDWWVFHGNWPTFGSLFTLTLPLLPFLKRSGRLALGYLATMLAIFVWYEIHHQDRYLQAIFPWMVAATAAALISAWRLGTLAARIPVAALVALQVIWGGDVPFFRTHNLIGDSMIRHTAELLAGGYEHRKPPAPFEPWISMGLGLPKKARPLVHATAMHLGMMRAEVQDLWVGGISYATLATPRGVYDALKGFGVTHLVFNTDRTGDDYPIASDLVFYEFAAQYAIDRTRYDEYTVAVMPSRAPEPSSPERNVIVYGCGGQYQNGWYRLSDLTTSAQLPTGRYPRERVSRGAYDSARILRDADFIAHDPTCQGQLPAEVAGAFQHLAARDRLDYYARRR